MTPEERSQRIKDLLAEVLALCEEWRDGVMPPAVWERMMALLEEQSGLANEEKRGF